MSMSMTKRQDQLFRFLCVHMKAHDVAPSFEEMREHLGLSSKSGIHRILTGLEERRLIRRMPNRQRALEILVHDKVAPAIDQNSYNAGYGQGQFDGYQEGAEAGFDAGVVWALQKLGRDPTELDNVREIGAVPKPRAQAAHPTGERP